MTQTRIPEIEVEMVKDKPLWHFHAGSVRASIWENERDINGKTFTVRDLTFSKRYRDVNGEYKNTTKYSANDIPKAMLVLQKAYEQMVTGFEDEPNGKGQ